MGIGETKARRRRTVGFIDRAWAAAFPFVFSVFVGNGSRAAQDVLNRQTVSIGQLIL